MLMSEYEINSHYSHIVYFALGVREAFIVSFSLQSHQMSLLATKLKKRELI